MKGNGKAHGSGGGSGGSSDSSPSPPPSPRRRASLSFCRRKLKSKPFLGGFRRKLRYLVVLPMLYISGLIMCVGPFSGLVSFSPPPPGSVYRSHQTFRRLRDEIRSDNSSAIEISSVWSYRRKLKEQKSCPSASAGQLYGSNGPSGYLIVEANGGLNQQRSAICNAVAVAGLLNAILVIPQFEFNSVWKDSSKFADIYDEEHFISTLEGYVKVVQDLPEEIMEKYEYNMSNIPNFRVEAWASVSYYTGVVYPVLRNQGVIRISPFANRLAMNVPPHIQFLRCLANYEALRFSAPISAMGRTLVNRMAEKSSRTGGKYISVHLRFEEDMVAFSCCLYDGAEAEKSEMDLIRERVWKQKFKRKDRIISPGLNRVEGKCPLSPVEVGMMLRGMGFDNKTSIFLASGKIYKEEKHLAPLLEMFPNLHTKETLASADEIQPFQAHSSRLAALDYTACLFSDVFVTTQGGNFPHFLMGHRRFHFGGHARTVIPDKRKLSILLEDKNISWKGFKDEMEAMLAESDRKGLIVPRVKKINRKSSVYTYPLPECRCLLQRQSSQLDPNRNSYF